MSYDRRYQQNRQSATPRFADPANILLTAARWVAYKEVQPVRAAWIEKKAATFEFAGAMYNAVMRFGDLTEGQNAAVDKCVARDAEWAANRATQPVRAPVGVDASKVVDAFRRGREAGLASVILRFSGCTISEAKLHPGTLYVKDGQTYLGKIVEGQFRSSRDCSPEAQARLVGIFADPEAAARVYGLETKSCSVCGHRLTNAESVTTGIGPVCAGRLGFTPGGIVRRAGTDF